MTAKHRWARASHKGEVRVQEPAQHGTSERSERDGNPLGRELVTAPRVPVGRGLGQL